MDQSDHPLQNTPASDSASQATVLSQRPKRLLLIGVLVTLIAVLTAALIFALLTNSDGDEASPASITAPDTTQVPSESTTAPVEVAPDAIPLDIVRAGSVSRSALCGSVEDCEVVTDAYVEQDEQSGAWVLRVGYNDLKSDELEESLGDRLGVDTSDFAKGPQRICESMLNAWPDWVIVESSVSGDALALGASNLTGSLQCSAREGSFRNEAQPCDCAFPDASAYRTGDPDES